MVATICVVVVVVVVVIIIVIVQIHGRANRSPEKAKIEAIDIHKNSLLQQKQNQDNEPW